MVSYRVPRAQSIVTPRSKCPSCGRQVAPRDNIPILSWLLLKGRCRHCRSAIGLRYPAVELATGILFAAVSVQVGLHRELLIALPFMALLVVVAAIDFEHRIVPNKILFVGAIWALGATALIDPADLPGATLAAAIAGTALLLVALAYPAGMGLGDVKLVAVMGLYLGSSVAVALLTAFVVGSAVGLGLMIRAGLSARKRAVPFAPFLALGGVTAQLVGSELIEWYTQTFF